MSVIRVNSIVGADGVGSVDLPKGTSGIGTDIKFAPLIMTTVLREGLVVLPIHKMLYLHLINLFNFLIQQEPYKYGRIKLDLREFY